MIATSLPALSPCGHAFDMDEHSWGELTDSSPLRNDMPASLPISNPSSTRLAAESSPSWPKATS